MNKFLIEFKKIKTKYNIRNIDIIWLFLWCLLLLNYLMWSVSIYQLIDFNEKWNYNKKCTITNVNNWKLDIECMSIKWIAKLHWADIHWIIINEEAKEKIDFLKWAEIMLLINQSYKHNEVSIWIETNEWFVDIWWTLIDLWYAKSNKKNEDYNYKDFIEKQSENKSLQRFFTNEFSK